MVERPAYAVGETVILLHLSLPLVGVSIGINFNRGCHQNDSLADGYCLEPGLDHHDQVSSLLKRLLKGEAGVIKMTGLSPAASVADAVC